VVDGAEWPASRPSHFILGERTLVNHWTGGSVGTRAGLDAIAKRKMSCPCRESNPEYHDDGDGDNLSLNTFIYMSIHTVLDENNMKFVINKFH